MNLIGTQPITTERLVLRKITMEDTQQLHEVDGIGNTLEEARSIVQMMVDSYDDRTFHWAITHQNAVIGRIKINEFSTRDSYADVAYGIGSAYRSKGFMTEALQAVIRFLLQDVGVHRMYAQVRASNLPSIKVVQKAGMVLEGSMRQHFMEADGTYVDVNIYGILQEDFDT